MFWVISRYLLIAWQTIIIFCPGPGFVCLIQNNVSLSPADDHTHHQVITCSDYNNNKKKTCWIETTLGYCFVIVRGGEKSTYLILLSLLSVPLVKSIMWLFLISLTNNSPVIYYNSEFSKLFFFFYHNVSSLEILHTNVTKSVIVSQLLSHVPGLATRGCWRWAAPDARVQPYKATRAENGISLTNGKSLHQLNTL